MNNLESPIVGKLDDNLYMCANGDVVIAVDEVMGDNNFSAEGDWEQAKGRLKKKLKKVGKAIKKKADKFGGTKVGKGIRKVRDVGKKIGLAIPRSAFSTILNVNLWGLASEFGVTKDKAKEGNPEEKKRWDKLLKKWENLGGKKSVFIDNVNNGRKRKARFISAKKRKAFKNKMANSADGEVYYIVNNPEYLYAAIVDDAGIATYITTGTAVLSAMIGAFGKKPQGMDDETKDIIDSEAAEDLAELEKLKNMSFTEKYKWHMIIGGSLIALGATAYFLLKKKQ